MPPPLRNPPAHSLTERGGRGSIVSPGPRHDMTLNATIFKAHLHCTLQAGQIWMADAERSVAIEPAILKRPPAPR